jgi:hypothetical protein
MEYMEGGSGVYIKMNERFYILTAFHVFGNLDLHSFYIVRCDYSGYMQLLHDFINEEGSFLSRTRDVIFINLSNTGIDRMKKMNLKPKIIHIPYTLAEVYDQDIFVSGYTFQGRTPVHKIGFGKAISIERDKQVLVTTAPAEPGQSGGSINDSNGDLIGILTQIELLDEKMIIKSSTDYKVPKSKGFFLLGWLTLDENERMKETESLVSWKMKTMTLNRFYSIPMVRMAWNFISRLIIFCFNL